MTQKTNHNPDNENMQEDETVQADQDESSESLGNNQGIHNTTHDLQRESAIALEMARQKLDREMGISDIAKIRFTESMILKLVIKESGKTIENAVNRDLIVGRADNITAYIPEMDMTDHGAYRLGLSRRHAIIQRDGEQLVVKDLNSRNGTFVNGAIVPGGGTHLIRDGDELRFGNLLTTVIFEKPV